MNRLPGCHASGDASSGSTQRRLASWYDPRAMISSIILRYRVILRNSPSGEVEYEVGRNDRGPNARSVRTVGEGGSRTAPTLLWRGLELRLDALSTPPRAGAVPFYPIAGV